MSGVRGVRAGSLGRWRTAFPPRSRPASGACRSGSIHRRRRRPSASHSRSISPVNPVISCGANEEVPDCRARTSQSSTFKFVKIGRSSGRRAVHRSCGTPASMELTCPSVGRPTTRGSSQDRSTPNSTRRSTTRRAASNWATSKRRVPPGLSPLFTSLMRRAASAGRVRSTLPNHPERGWRRQTPSSVLRRSGCEDRGCLAVRPNCSNRGDLQ